MDNYQTILVAVDFAPEGKAVLDRALQLARTFSAKLLLVHVVEYMEFAYSGEIVAPEEVLVDRELATQAQQRLEELRRQLAWAHTEILVELGSPKREIVRVAEERSVDLILIGSHGRQGLQLLLGSTANGVLHLAQCDVLAVRIGI